MLYKYAKITLASLLLFGSVNVISKESSENQSKEIFLNHLVELDFELPANLVLRQGNRSSYKIVGDDESIIHAKVSLKPGGDLTFSPKEMDIGSTDIKNLTVYMTVKDLNKLKLGKYAKAQVSNLRLKKLNLELEDHSVLKGNITADQLLVTIKGVSDVVLKGFVKRQNLLINGNANYDAINLKTLKTSLDVEGDGLIKLNVTKELTVTVKGKAKVVYTGSPKVFDHKVSGQGCVRKLSSKSCHTKGN